MSAPKSMSLDKVFAVLTPALAVDPVAVTPSLYADLDANYDKFKGHTLVALHEFSAPWGMWEKHPAGDEIVVLMAGKITFRIRTATGEDSVALDSPGEYLVVPKDHWHTADTDVATKVLFITPGEGTAHKADE